MVNILDEIIARKRVEIATAKAAVSLDALRRLADQAPPPRAFTAALTAPGVRVIAECKKQSPSRGVMSAHYDPVRLARAYEAGGAAAISVLTDLHFFGGRLSDLTAVRQAVSLPVLRKDFIVDPYQIYEARAATADTFLLLAGVLSQEELETLVNVGRSLGMEPLVESHTAAELDEAVGSSAVILGINNRDLKSFSIDLDTARSLRQRGENRVPKPVMVCESGIKTRNDIELMTSVGYKVFLIGEALVTHSDPESALVALIAP